MIGNPEDGVLRRWLIVLSRFGGPDVDIARYSFDSCKHRILAIVRRELRKELFAIDDVLACESFEFLAFTLVDVNNRLRRCPTARRTSQPQLRCLPSKRTGEIIPL